MATQRQPKVLLFDIGGVCVVSPFQAILDYELSLGIPPGWVNYSISQTKPHGFWHRLERGAIPMDQAFFAGFNADLHHQGRWHAFYTREAAKKKNGHQLSSSDVPPVPRMDGEWLFNEMMTASNHPDPWMFPALQKLQESGRYILAALSNTVIFPVGHPLHAEPPFDDPVRRIFDVFVSSAHVGMRKPDPKIYQYALEQVDKYAKDHGKGSVGPGDIVFLDDIGENLKEAKRQGFQTIKVPLGRTYEAVEALERITGLQLDGGHPKIAIEPRYPAPKAKM
ncbi:haloacid dehalogenase-like hydrolase [Emericellopsis atlantica]|uniref:Haloacid dehalogenase-like hydrolase n=1 Tax=Emericellopsis atlantica TaxID=2614577 RepID=A0A9P7ZEE9_9HYPO|nr:haloacid dehalogenase-like hydrolase [Emericellopsis atlantica]KAG9250206.1 haloacid dehalogenase-like hydrolase [Emericellopsis atlantica]